MSSTGINMSDKTVVISGPFGLLMQSLTQVLTEAGADVALLVDDANAAQRFCQNISDLKEMSEKYGRAAALQAKFTNEKEAQIDFSRCAELFGTTDVYIDLHLFGTKIPFFTNDVPASADKEFEKNFEKTKLMSQAALFFLRSRHKSRVLYIFNELDKIALEKIDSNRFTECIDYIKKMATDTIKDHITFNALGVGVSEEFLVARFNKGPISVSLKTLQQTLPLAKLVEYRDIGNMVAFMVSPLSNALNGQVVRLNHGLV